MMRIDNMTLKARVKDIEDALRQDRLEALIVYANGSMLGSASKMHGYLRYLTNFDGHNTPAMLVLRPGHEPILVSGTNPILMQLQHRELLWFKDVRLTKAPLFGNEIVSILGKSERNGNWRMGYVGLNETPAPVWTAINKGLPGVQWVDFTPQLDQRRVQKDDLQLAFHRRAAEICDAIFQTVQREVRTGLKGYQLQACMEHTARHEGTEYCITWLTVAPRADYPRFYKEECARVPQEGDQMIPGIYLTYDGHWGHAIRTGTVGKPTDDHRKIYDIVREMQEACLARLKPGEDLLEAVNAMDDVVYKYYREEDVSRSRAGHGLGLSYEDPIVSGAFFHPWEFKDKPHPGANRIEIKPGMLMEVHPNLFVPGVAGAMIGDMVAITDTSYEIFTEYPRDLIIW
jgi:Xaa-Pro aminopeptidase